MTQRFLMPAVGILAVAALAAHAPLNASVIDPGTFAAEGQLDLHEPVAANVPPEQQTSFTAAFPGADARQVGSARAASAIDYAFTDHADGSATLNVAGSSSAADSPLSSAEAVLSATFETTRTTRFDLSATVGSPPIHFAAAVNDATIDFYPDIEAPDGLGGNYRATDGAITGFLEPGVHTFTFSVTGGGHRGAASWAADADATLELTAVPEPATAAILALAALLASGRRPLLSSCLAAAWPHHRRLATPSPHSAVIFRSTVCRMPPLR